MSKTDQIAHRAREVSMAKTSILRTVVSERLGVKHGTATYSASHSNPAGKQKI